MLTVPVLPLNTEFKELLDFCLRFRTVGGFIRVYEEKLTEFGKPGVAYEATEQFYCQLFGHRRYADRDQFYNVKSWYYRDRRK